MAPSSKSTAAAKDRRKSNNTATAAVAAVTSASSPKNTLVVALKVPPKKLRAIVDPDFIKEDTPVKQSPAAAPNNSGTENASDSTPNSPPAGTPAAQSVNMGPPSDGPKKKGVKRSAGAAANGNGEPKVRGKPGPKKKQRLEDGTIDPSASGPSAARGSLAAHRLGPKANQGAINAGLRALDRSGKPCRRWARGGFALKSFTGVVWEIPRWTAPPKPVALLARGGEESTDGNTDTNGDTPASASASVDGSNKENVNGESGGGGNGGGGGSKGEDASQAVKSEVASQNGGGGGADADVQSAAASFVADASPAPAAVDVAAA